MASPSLLRSFQFYVFVLNVFLLVFCFSGVFDFYNSSGVGLQKIISVFVSSRVTLAQA